MTNLVGSKIRLTEKTSTLTKLRSYLAKTWPLYIMIAPGLALLIVFRFYPMYGLQIAFRDYNPGLGFTGSKWIGLQQFVFLFSLSDFAILLRNTLVIAIAKIISIQLCSIVLAILLNEVRSILFRRTLNSVIYLPHFMSWIVAAGILIDMFGSNGLIGQLLKPLGIQSSMFLGRANWFVPFLVVTNLWKEVGWSTIIYLAALTGIDPTLQEAAAVDGASHFQRIWYILLPGITPIILLISCLSLGSVLDAGFEQVLNLYNPGVLETGDILDTYIYRAGLIQARYSLATAAGLFRSLVGFILISISYWLAYKFSDFRIF